VDVEFVKPETGVADLAARFFAPGEVRALEAVSGELKVDAFFSCWTRKEAYLKALGMGLSLPLHHFEVNLAPGLPARLVKPHRLDGTLWSMYELEAPPGYKAALVAEGDGHRVQHLDSSAQYR
jgi:4'-phosphopantetheinyl transferase